MGTTVATGLDTAFWISPGFTVFATAVFGLLVGSFLNVVIHRLPRMMEARWAAEAAELADQAADSQAVDGPAAVKVAPEAAAPFNLVVPRSRCPHCGHAITALENIPLLSWLWLTHWLR